jgi:hypothetical protein
MQSQRRVLVPGPRGNIYDREGNLLVGNRPRFAVVLYLDELRREFRDEYIRVRKNYRASGDVRTCPAPSDGAARPHQRGAALPRPGEPMSSGGPKAWTASPDPPLHGASGSCPTPCSTT